MQKSWNDFIIGLDKLKHPASNIDTGPFPTSGGPASGFVEFHPKYDIQKKYDAQIAGDKGAQRAIKYAEIDAILKWNDIYNKYYEMKSFNIMDITNNKNIDLSIFEKTNNKIKQCN
jgi:hypothetical protein